MFMVINKDKIISYLVSFSTVAILFGFSFFMTKNNEKILETSTNVDVYNSVINKKEENILEVNKTKIDNKYFNNESK